MTHLILDALGLLPLLHPPPLDQPGVPHEAECTPAANHPAIGVLSTGDLDVEANKLRAPLLESDLDLLEMCIVSMGIVNMMTPVWLAHAVPQAPDVVVDVRECHPGDKVSILHLGLEACERHIRSETGLPHLRQDQIPEPCVGPLATSPFHHGVLVLARGPLAGERGCVPLRGGPHLLVNRLGVCRTPLGLWALRVLGRAALFLRAAHHVLVEVVLHRLDPLVFLILAP